MTSPYIGEVDDLAPSSKETAKRDARLAMVATAPSESLCHYVVLFRTLGLEKQFSILCMEELVRRRDKLGDEFFFEDFIDSAAKTVPIPNGKLQPLGIFKKL
jgi:hypothetical protein